MSDQVCIKKRSVYSDDEKPISKTRRSICKIPMPIYACLLVFCMVITIGTIITVPMLLSILSDDRNITIG